MTDPRVRANVRMVKCGERVNQAMIQTVVVDRGVFYSKMAELKPRFQFIGSKSMIIRF